MKKAIKYSVAVCLASWIIYYSVVTIAGSAFTGNANLMAAFKTVYMFFPMLTAMAFQVIGRVMMCIFCILAGIIELYFVLKTRSVIIAAVIHGCINALAGAVVLCVIGGNDLTIGLTGVAGFISLALICLAIYIYDSKISKQNILTSSIETPLT